MPVIFVYENDGVSALMNATGAQAARAPSTAKTSSDMPINLDLTVHVRIKNMPFMQQLYAETARLVCAVRLPASRNACLCGGNACRCGGNHDRAA